MCTLFQPEDPVYDYLTADLQRQDESYQVSCVSDELLLMSNFDQLDVDGDGFWTKVEATALSKNYTGAVGRYVNLAKVFSRVASLIMDVASTKQLLEESIPTCGGTANGADCRFPFNYEGKEYFECTDVDHDQPWCYANASIRAWGNCNCGVAGSWYARNQADTIKSKQLQELLGVNSRCQADSACTQDGDYRIPMDYLKQRTAPLFKVCALLDAQLCDNMILRRSMAKHLTTDTEGSMTQELKVALGLTGERPLFFVEDLASLDRDSCPKILQDFCPLATSKSTELWRERKPEFCGISKFKSVEAQGIWGNAVKFSGSGRYRGDLGITTTTFIAFILLILFLWDLAVAYETQVLMSWLLVLLRLPASRPGKPLVSMQDNLYVIHSIPRHHRLAMLFWNLLPRAMLTMMMVYCGIIYLLTITSIEDLVLNALGLTFLMTVDDLLFLAFSSAESKAFARQCAPIQVDIPRVAGLQHPQVVVQYAVLFVIVSFTCYKAYMSYLGPEGKVQQADAFQCLCEAEGSRCLTAQLVGGMVNLSVANFG